MIPPGRSDLDYQAGTTPPTASAVTRSARDCFEETGYDKVVGRIIFKLIRDDR